jgi:hypothetical protein
MTTIQEVFRAVSTNGRWGLAVVAETKTAFPAKGKLALLGVFEGVKTYKFTADEGGQWIYVGGDLVPVVGAVVVDSESLQSGNHATIVAGGEFFVIKDYGYMRRRSEIIAFNKGVRVKLPATVMAAMGLIPSENKPIAVEVPAIESPIAEALRKAGIV